MLTFLDMGDIDLLPAAEARLVLLDVWVSAMEFFLMVITASDLVDLKNSKGASASVIKVEGKLFLVGGKFRVIVHLDCILIHELVDIIFGFRLGYEDLRTIRFNVNMKKS